MKKRWLAVSMAAVISLSGCSFLEEVNGTLDYVNEATDYVNDATEFANEVPALAEEALTDVGALKEFETRLLAMKVEIETFNDLNAPALAEDVHQQVLEHNNQALDGINQILTTIESGDLNPDLLENTELFTTFEEMTNLSEQIQKLGE